MDTQIERQSTEHESDEHLAPRDQFVRQVDDRSRPALQVLREQLDGREEVDAAPLFIP